MPEEDEYSVIVYYGQNDCIYLPPEEYKYLDDILRKKSKRTIILSSLAIVVVTFLLSLLIKII